MVALFLRDFPELETCGERVVPDAVRILSEQSLDMGSVELKAALAWIAHVQHQHLFLYQVRRMHLSQLWTHDMTATTDYLSELEPGLLLLSSVPGSLTVGGILQTETARVRITGDRETAWERPESAQFLRILRLPALSVGVTVEEYADDGRLLARQHVPGATAKG